MSKDIILDEGPAAGDAKPQAVPVSSTPADTSDIQKYYRALHARCGAILERSVASENGRRVAKSHEFFREVDLWCGVLGKRGEVELLRTAAHEYQYALLALCHGNYRHAFKALRLVLELILQSTHLSANELELREWLSHRKDTIWAVLMDPENGVFSPRFAHAFFPEVEPHIAYHRLMAMQVYRECSECVHGNIPKFVPLPETLEFSQESFDLWHAKADVVALIAHFVLSLRHLRAIPEESVSKLESVLVDRVAHIQEIRVKIGGVFGG
jgi:hypothetical protein